MLLFGNSSAYVQIQLTNCITHFLVSLLNQLQRGKKVKIFHFVGGLVSNFMVFYYHYAMSSLSLGILFGYNQFFPLILIQTSTSANMETLLASYLVFSHSFLLTELQFCSIAIGLGKTSYLPAFFIASDCHMPYQIELYVIFSYVYKNSG